MRFHQPTIDYVSQRTAEGLAKRDLIRCLKRFLAREIYQRVLIDHRAGPTGKLRPECHSCLIGASTRWMSR